MESQVIITLRMAGPLKSSAILMNYRNTNTNISMKVPQLSANMNMTVNGPRNSIDVQVKIPHFRNANMSMNLQSITEVGLTTHAIFRQQVAVVLANAKIPPHRSKFRAQWSTTLNKGKFAQQFRKPIPTDPNHNSW